MTKMRIVVHHVATDTYWYGEFVKANKHEAENAKELFQSICESGNYLSLTNEHGSVYFFPKNFIQECVFTLQKGHKDD